MAKKLKLSDEELVSNFIANLDENLKEIVSLLRETILQTDVEIAEQIKWNSPSFYYKGEMEPFDPKEYKRDIVVLNLHRGNILLVFPTGAKVQNTYGVLEGNFPDTRKVIKVLDKEDLLKKIDGIQNVIKEWLSLVEK